MGNPSGPKTGGRQKGTPNKDTTLLADLADKLDCNPFEVLLHFVNGDYEALGYEKYQDKSTPTGEVFQVLTIEPELRARCAQNACNFLYPKRKALEVSMDEESSKTFNLAYSAESLATFKANRDQTKKAK